MKKLIVFIVLLWALPGWAAEYEVCSSGCDGTIANFEAAASPFDDLAGDTVTFTDAAQSDTLTLPDAFGSSESERATLVFTGVTITDDAEACLSTAARDYITISGGSWVGGNGNTACIEVTANSVGITLDGITVTPGAGDRAIRVWYGADNFILTDSTITGGTTTNNLLHFFINDTNSLSDVLISGNAFSGGYSHNISAAGPGTGSMTFEDVIISDNTFDTWGNSTGDTAILILWTNSTVIKNIDILRNTFTDGVGRGIYLQNQSDDDTDAAYGIDINGNTFSNNGYMSLDINQVASTGGTSYIRNNSVYLVGGAGGAANINGVRCGACNGVIIEGNTVYSTKSSSGDGNGIIIDKHMLNSIDNQPSVNCIVRRNLVYDNTTVGGRGISVFASTGTEVYNNVSYGNVRGIGSGGNATQGSTGTLMHNNTTYNNSDAGIQVREYGGTVTAYNNILDSNDYGILEESGADIPTIDSNLYNNNTTNDILDEDAGALAKGANAVTADPLFIDATNNDFRLRWGSPAIDAGTPVSIHAYGSYLGDYADNLYIWGRGVDIGAYEYYDETLAIAKDNLVGTLVSTTIVGEIVGSAQAFKCISTNTDCWYVP